MPYEVNDVLHLQFEQDYLGANIMNSLWYRVKQIVSGQIVPAVLDSLLTQLIVIIKQLQATTLTHYQQVVVNLSDGLTTDKFNIVRFGDDTTGEEVASFIALGYKKQVSSKLTRPGSLRIAGLREDSVIGNAFPPSVLTAILAIGNSLSGDKSANDGGANSAIFEPVVVGRLPNGTFDLTKVNPVIGFGVPRLTTQNSRKIFS